MQQGRWYDRARRTSAVIAVSAMALAMGAYRGNGRQPESAGNVEASWSPDGGPATLGTGAGTISTAIQARLAERPEGVGQERWARVQRAYAAQGDAPLWLAADALDERRAASLARALLDATGDALRLDAYPIDALAAAVDAVRGAERSSAEQLAAADVLLTTVYVSLAEELLNGQIDPASASQEWRIRGRRKSVDSAVAEALRDPRPDAALARLRPEGAEYGALREALVRYRDLAARGGWPTVPAGRKLRPGQADAPARLAALRERLRIEGYGAGTPDSAARPDLYDRTLAGLVADFQARHGIGVDSVLGAETVRALGVPAAYRLGQIAANLERARWMPRTLGERYILVNVPAFRLEAHDPAGSLEMRVVVGKDDDGTRTPVFSDSLESVVFRPYWNITPDIQAEETEPRIAADPAYMAENDLEYYRDGRETRIRQRPGANNALGFVKFLFPNDYNVYLHDTPQDALFAKDVRALSHGCVRLDRPAELAQWVLGWDAGRVDDAMHVGPDDRGVTLPQKIPVYIVYQTAYTRDGVLHFGNDVYDRDDALVASVARGAAPSEETLRRLELLRAIAAR